VVTDDGEPDKPQGPVGLACRECGGPAEVLLADVDGWLCWSCTELGAAVQPDEAP
jgi:hypothetical protein